MLIKDAIVSVYCMVREVVGEENRITVYASGEYAFLMRKHLLKKRRLSKIKEETKNLSKYITGMDDLLERGIYHKFGEGKIH
ncbi:MAG: hypothetical protein ACLRWM_07900 [Streptococcus sp.]